MIPYLSHGIGVDETQFATPTSPGFTGDALKVDRAVAAANEAYDTYRLKTAIAARDARRVDRAVAAANEAYDTIPQVGDRGAPGPLHGSAAVGRPHRRLGADEASRDGHAADRVVCQ